MTYSTIPDDVRLSAARQLDPLAWSVHYGSEERREHALATVDKVAAILRLSIINEWELIRKADPIHVDNIDGQSAELWLATHDAKILTDAADAIQALHPGEVKASVEFLRERAKS